ncbi:MAG TPA: class I SAM-dependent methyltransferase [Micromonosporaceae bacterium]
MAMEQALTDTGWDWEQQAHNWIGWARRPGFDSYWRYRDAFFHLVPPPGRATLDLGCGEGRVARDLAGRGHTVTGVDASPTLLAAARDADPTGTYLLADAADLPFDDGAFDLVVAYNTLMDVDDLPGSVRQAGRVLSAGGRLVLAVTHPVTNVGSFPGDAPGEGQVFERDYFVPRRFREEVEQDGMRMVFHGWERPLQAYTGALEDAGLLIEALREPVAVRRDGTALRVPLHLWIAAVRL